MTSDQPTPFEQDIAEQPGALRRLADHGTPELGPIVDRAWDRIVLTGMGSSHYAGLPTWRALVGAGLPAWAIETAQLLDSPELVTQGTLVIATSQSGASGEIAELLERRSSGDIASAVVVGVADDPTSPLAQQADLFLPLRSGPEATVSTKSYLNTLAVHAQLISAFGRQDPVGTLASIDRTADAVEAAITDLPLDAVASVAASHPKRRLVYIGRGDESATALFAALITKESSKVPAQGFIGGEFRHGPFELAGDGLTAFFFAQPESDQGLSLRRLAVELVAAGSTVVYVGDAPDGAMQAGRHPASALERLALGAVVAERFAVSLALANGYVPGAFLHGSKVTTAL